VFYKRFLVARPFSGVTSRTFSLPSYTRTLSVRTPLAQTGGKAFLEDFFLWSTRRVRADN
jgi:hypothetical protein